MSAVMNSGDGVQPNSIANDDGKALTKDAAVADSSLNGASEADVKNETDEQAPGSKEEEEEEEEGKSKIKIEEADEKENTRPRRQRRCPPIFMKEQQDGLLSAQQNQENHSITPTQPPILPSSQLPIQTIIHHKRCQICLWQKKGGCGTSQAIPRCERHPSKHGGIEQPVVPKRSSGVKTKRKRSMPTHQSKRKRRQQSFPEYDGPQICEYCSRTYRDMRALRTHWYSCSLSPLYRGSGGRAGERRRKRGGGGNYQPSSNEGSSGYRCNSCSKFHKGYCGTTGAHKVCERKPPGWDGIVTESLRTTRRRPSRSTNRSSSNIKRSSSSTSRRRTNNKLIRYYHHPQSERSFFEQLIATFKPIDRELAKTFWGFGVALCDAKRQTPKDPWELLTAPLKEIQQVLGEVDGLRIHRAAVAFASGGPNEARLLAAVRRDPQSFTLGKLKEVYNVPVPMARWIRRLYHILRVAGCGGDDPMISQRTPTPPSPTPTTTTTTCTKDDDDGETKVTTCTPVVATTMSKYNSGMAMRWRCCGRHHDVADVVGGGDRALHENLVAMKCEDVNAIKVLNNSDSGEYERCMVCQETYNLFVETHCPWTHVTFETTDDAELGRRRRGKTTPTEITTRGNTEKYKQSSAVTTVMASTSASPPPSTSSPSPCYYYKDHHKLEQVSTKLKCIKALLLDIEAATPQEAVKEELRDNKEEEEEKKKKKKKVGTAKTKLSVKKEGERRGEHKNLDDVNLKQEKEEERKGTEGNDNNNSKTTDQDEKQLDVMMMVEKKNQETTTTKSNSSSSALSSSSSSGWYSTDARMEWIHKVKFATSVKELARALQTLETWFKEEWHLNKSSSSSSSSSSSAATNSTSTSSFDRKAWKANLEKILKERKEGKKKEVQEEGLGMQQQQREGQQKEKILESGDEDRQHHDDNNDKDDHSGKEKDDDNGDDDEGQQGEQEKRVVMTTKAVTMAREEGEDKLLQALKQFDKGMVFIHDGNDNDYNNEDDAVATTTAPPAAAPAEVASAPSAAPSAASLPPTPQVAAAPAPEVPVLPCGTAAAAATSANGGGSEGSETDDDGGGGGDGGATTATADDAVDPDDDRNNDVKSTAAAPDKQLVMKDGIMKKKHNEEKETPAGSSAKDEELQIEEDDDGSETEVSSETEEDNDDEDQSDTAKGDTKNPAHDVVIQSAEDTKQAGGGGDGDNSNKSPSASSLPPLNLKRVREGQCARNPNCRYGYRHMGFCGGWIKTPRRGRGRRKEGSLGNGNSTAGTGSKSTYNRMKPGQCAKNPSCKYGFRHVGFCGGWGTRRRTKRSSSSSSNRRKMQQSKKHTDSMMVRKSRVAAAVAASAVAAAMMSSSSSSSSSSTDIRRMRSSTSKKTKDNPPGRRRRHHRRLFEHKGCPYSSKCPRPPGHHGLCGPLRRIWYNELTPAASSSASSSSPLSSLVSFSSSSSSSSSSSASSSSSTIVLPECKICSTGEVPEKEVIDSLEIYAFTSRPEECKCLPTISLPAEWSLATAQIIQSQKQQQQQQLLLRPVWSEYGKGEGGWRELPLHSSSSANQSSTDKLAEEMEKKKKKGTTQEEIEEEEEEERRRWRKRKKAKDEHQQQRTKRRVYTSASLGVQGERPPHLNDDTNEADMTENEIISRKLFLYMRKLGLSQMKVSGQTGVPRWAISMFINHPNSPKLRKRSDISSRISIFLTAMADD